MIVSDSQTVVQYRTKSKCKEVYLFDSHADLGYGVLLLWSLRQTAPTGWESSLGRFDPKHILSTAPIHMKTGTISGSRMKI